MTESVNANIAWIRISISSSSLHAISTNAEVMSTFGCTISAGVDISKPSNPIVRTAACRNKRFLCDIAGCTYFKKHSMASAAG